MSLVRTLPARAGRKSLVSRLPPPRHGDGPAGRRLLLWELMQHTVSRNSSITIGGRTAEI